jgi:hypothetical protein
MALFLPYFFRDMEGHNVGVFPFRVGPFKSILPINFEILLYLRLNEQFWNVHTVQNIVTARGRAANITTTQPTAASAVEEDSSEDED